MSLQFIKHFLQSPRQLKPHTYVPHFIACLLSCCFATTALSFVLMAHLMCNGVVSNSCSLTTLASLHRTNSSTKLLIVSSLHSTPLSSITCMPFGHKFAHNSMLSAACHITSILGTTCMYTYDVRVFRVFCHLFCHRRHSFWWPIKIASQFIADRICCVSRGMSLMPR